MEEQTFAYVSMSHANTKTLQRPLWPSSTCLQGSICRGVAGVRPRLEKPRPRLENVSKNAAGVAFWPPQLTTVITELRPDDRYFNYALMFVYSILITKKSLLLSILLVYSLDFRATVSAARCLVVLPLLHLLLAVVCASHWQNKMMMMINCSAE